MNTKIITILIFFSSLLCGFLWSYIFNMIHQDATVTMYELENKIVNIVKYSSPSIVNIVINKDLTIYRNDPLNFFYQPVWNITRKVWGGTWFFITNDGIIITNKHVIQDLDADYTVILSNGKEYKATLLWVSPNKDIALIKINISETVNPLNFINSYDWMRPKIDVGQFAIATWYALAEFKNSVTFGIISWTDRSISTNWEILTWLLQTDAAINPWNSGWPLMNLEWKVMWINTAVSWGAQWIWFAIPLSQRYIDTLLLSVE